MPKDLKAFIKQVKAQSPEDLLEIPRLANPNDYETTAVLEHLTKSGLFPMVIFPKTLNVLGGECGIPLISNVFATRQRCAMALGLPSAKHGLELSLKQASLERGREVPCIIGRDEAPVKEVVRAGEEVDVGQLPIVRHYAMDIGPVLTMVVIMKDPDTGMYDASFVKTFYKDLPRRMGISIHSPHLERILAKYEARGQAAPVINVLGHHPAFFLGCLALSAYDINDYETIGSFLGEPLRLVESETWGDQIMVPADSEIIIEGEIAPGAHEVVDPFGEVTRHYQAQCLRQSLSVTALTRRGDAYLQDILSGHEGHWNLGAIPKEGSVYNSLKARLGNVVAVHCPHSGVGRLACYISIDKRREGDAKLAGLVALTENFTFQVVVVVDKDIDVFNEKEVIWAILTMVDPQRDISYNANLYTVFTTAMGHNKVVIDATRPLDRAFPAKLEVPQKVMQRVNLQEWLGSNPVNGY